MRENSSILWPSWTISDGAPTLPDDHLERQRSKLLQEYSKGSQCRDYILNAKPMNIALPTLQAERTPTLEMGNVLCRQTPIIFFSGLFETPHIWDPVLRILTDRRIRTAALPGHTPREAPRQIVQSLTSGEWHTSMGRAMAHLACGGRVHLVGHSSGGMVALQLAHQFPTHVRSLTLVGAPMDGCRDIPFDPGAAALKNDYVGRYILPWLWHRSLSSRKAFERAMATVVRPQVAAHVPDEMRRTLRQCDPEAVRLFAKWLLTQDVSALASKITAPTLLVIGSRDRVVPAKHQIALLRNIPTAQARVVPGGHLPFLEDPDAFAQTLRLWFAHT